MLSLFSGENIFENFDLVNIIVSYLDQKIENGTNCKNSLNLFGYTYIRTISKNFLISSLNQGGGNFKLKTFSSATWYKEISNNFIPTGIKLKNGVITLEMWRSLNVSSLCNFESLVDRDFVFKIFPHPLISIIDNPIFEILNIYIDDNSLGHNQFYEISIRKQNKKLFHVAFGGTDRIFDKLPNVLYYMGTKIVFNIKNYGKNYKKNLELGDVIYNLLIGIIDKQFSCSDLEYLKKDTPNYCSAKIQNNNEHIYNIIMQ